MKTSDILISHVKLSSIRTFTDYQAWIKGLKNATGVYEYIKLTQMNEFDQGELMETVLRLRNKEHEVEIRPIFPQEMMDLISTAIINSNARLFIPVEGVKLVVKRNRGMWRRDWNHDIVEIDLMKREISKMEMEFLKTDLLACIEEMKRHITYQIR